MGSVATTVDTNIREDGDNDAINAKIILQKMEL